MFRTPNKRGEGARLLTYASAGTAAGAITGLLLGLVGGLMPAAVRAAVAVILALAIGAVAVVELAGRRVPLIQIDRETPYGWLAPGPLWWGLRNGASLGFGARTRLGFWLWYVIPFGALLSGHPLLGALGYGLYGFTRTAGVIALMRIERRGRIGDVEVLRSSSAARMVTNAQLVVMAVLTIVLAGS